ncbi:GerAB/ArcD/ProY family transporter [Halalkalibacter kiskunsagensis]|uniref:GerAB/ArcD/ProY family transporter n=1 Tax=Halalkalibacter kiskunsagensis TaxID=1548599 RepID=A0ABV6K8L3_9BACI
MIRISNIQLFVLIMVFEVGSTTLFALGIGAKQDAWIVILLSAIVGLALVWVYTQFPKYYPNQNFSEILNDVVGKVIAIPLLLLYGLYFFGQASHNFYEFGLLIKMTALEKTPLIVILYFFIFVMIYILSLGFEVLARTCEILLPYLVGFLVIIYILTLFSGQVDFSSLRPVLGDGLQPILGELHRVIAFPFGEMVVFLMFWHYIDDQKLIRKTALLAVGIAAFLLMISLIVIVSILDSELAANVEVPLLETILTINIAEIITNLDSIAVFIMFIGGFYKTALHFWGFSLAMTWLFNVKSSKWIMGISGLLLPLFSIYRFPGFAQQRWIGEMGLTTILIFSFLPVLLCVIMFMKQRKKS